MLCKEVITVCYQVHTQHRNTQFGQNVDLLNTKIRGTYCINWAL
jgi:hypothetical protein